MKTINIEDLRRRSNAKVPNIFFDYLDGGAGSEATFRRNRADFWPLGRQLVA
jgi:L-lactate dehydrogenase (cytochrome)